jgi:hypothetical protein
VNKTVNLIIFFIVATVFSLAVMFALIIVLGRLVSFVPDTLEGLQTTLGFVSIIGSMVLTFLIYSWVMKKAVKWFNLEKNIPQLFKKKK